MQEYIDFFQQNMILSLVWVGSSCRIYHEPREISGQPHTKRLT